MPNPVSCPSCKSPDTRAKYVCTNCGTTAEVYHPVSDTLDGQPYPIPCPGCKRQVPPYSLTCLKCGHVVYYAGPGIPTSETAKFKGPSPQKP